MPETRLDVALVARGLARSRSHAVTLIADGLVTVDERSVVKPSAKVGDDRRVAVATADRYVGRGAHKLIAALDAFDVRVDGRLALDLGASTGGFSQVLLERGARQVIALDVGHGQLSPVVASEPRLVSVEGVNARYLTSASLTEASGVLEPPDIVVGDLSFISLKTVLPAIRETAAADADFVLLIKPQFEVGRTGIHEGIVRDRALRADAVAGVLWAAWDLGLRTAGLIASPIAGAHGNREYLAWLNARVGDNPTEWLREITALTASP